MSLYSTMLESTATLYRPTIGRDAVQGVIQTFVQVWTGYPCNVSKSGPSAIVLYGQRNTRVGVTLTFIQDPQVQVNDIIKSSSCAVPDAIYYLVHGQSQSVPRGRIWTVDAEEIDAPDTII